MDALYTKSDLERFRVNFRNGLVMGCGYYWVCSDPLCPLKSKFEELHVDPCCHLKKEQTEVFNSELYVKELEISRKRMLEGATGNG